LKTFGYLLITISFLAASYLAVIDVEVVPWGKAVPAMLVGVVGVVLLRVSSRGQRKSIDKVRSSIGKLEQSLAAIVANAEKLDAEKESIDPYEIRHRIDELFMNDLDTFVENRETIGDAYGLQAYADVMTHFATGERYLNRCWSASTDGYIEVIHKYLSRATSQFEQALELLQSYTKSTQSS
jgi:hypothetical protein